MTTLLCPVICYGKPGRIKQTHKALSFYRGKYKLSRNSIIWILYVCTLEKETATHSSIYAWKIPWTEEPGGLQSMGSQRVGHNWATCVCVCVCVCALSCSVVSDSLWSYGLYPFRLLYPLDFPGKKTGVVCHYLLQGILPIQGSNLHLLCLLHCSWVLRPLSHQGFP